MTVVLSGSSVSTYLTCRLRWWFEYVAAMEVEASEPQRVGIQIHDAAEMYLKGTVARDSIIHTDPVLRPLERVFRDEILPTTGEILLVEHPFSVDVNGIPFTGVIDWLERHHKTWGIEHILRDLKTTGSRPSNSARYDFAMTGYYVGVTEGLGYDITAMLLDWIVRTKKPYYWPMKMDLPDEYAIAGWAVTLEHVAEDIARGDYRPTGLSSSWACKSCNYREVCGPYQRYKEVTE